MPLRDTVLSETLPDKPVLNRQSSLNRSSAAHREPVLRADLTLLPWMRTVAQVFETADRMLARGAAHNARHAIHLELARRRDWADEAETWLALSDTGS